MLTPAHPGQPSSAVPSRRKQHPRRARLCQEPRARRKPHHAPAHSQRTSPPVCPTTNPVRASPPAASSPQAAATTSSALQGAPQAAPRACSHQPTRLPSSRSCAVTTYPRLSLRRRASPPPTSALLPSGLPRSGAAGASSLDQLATPASSTFDCAHRPSARRRMYPVPRLRASRSPTVLCRLYRRADRSRSPTVLTPAHATTRTSNIAVLAAVPHQLDRDVNQQHRLCRRLTPDQGSAMHLRRRGPGAVQLCRCASVTSRR